MAMGYKINRASALTRGLLAGTALVAASGLMASAAQAAAEADNTVQAVVVTGSLISSKNYVAASPIVTTSIEAIQQSGAVNVEDVLNQAPQFTPSGTAANGGQGTGGHATVNLHGLGSNRNLVLLDGRRLPPADIAGNIDINLIPESILSGVDVITGGASAVYGSDAMSGVVNFITVKKFEGVRADVQYGNSTKGDYAQFTSNVAFGTSFADGRGNLIASVGYTKDDGLAGSARSFFNLVTPSSYIGQGTFVPSATNLPTQAAVSSLFTGYGITSTVARTLNLGFNNDGTLFPQTGAINYKGPTSGGYAIIGGNVRMPVGPQTIIENPLDRTSLYSKFDYELTPHITAYGQVLYVDSTVTTSSGKSLTQLQSLTTIPVTNPFIPADLATLLASRPNPTAPFLWNGRYVGLPNKSWSENYVTSQFLGGLKGDVGYRDWTWDIYADYDKTDHNQTNHNAVLKSQVQNLLNAPDGGKSLCAGGFDPFGLANSSNISAACQAYMTTTAHSTETLSEADVQAVTQGTLFTVPAGNVVLAVLADYRRNTYTYSPDSQLAAGNIEAVVQSSPSHGVISVKEYAAQVDVPLLKDLPFVKKLNLGAAFRTSDYSSTGSVNSYEGDLKWFVNDDVLIRAGYQRAVRAPNIAELFSAVTGSQVAIGTPPASIGDPCDVRSTARTGASGASVRALCIAQGIPSVVVDTYQFPTTAVGGISSGNKNLTPEVADTFNYGVVWTPHFAHPLLSRMSVSVDYWNIQIQKAISVIPGITALSKCYNLDGSNPTYSASNPFCALIQRDSNGQLTQILTPYLNLGGLRTDGVDIQANWRAALTDMGVAVPGDVSVTTSLSYTASFKVQTLPGTPFAEYVGTNTIVGATPAGPHPDWKALTTFGYHLGAVDMGVRWRYLDGMKDVSVITSPTHPSVGTPTYQLIDLFGTYKINSKWQVRAGVTNLFDHDLPVVSSSQTSTDPATFDAVGRSYYVGLKAAF